MNTRTLFVPAAALLAVAALAPLAAPAALAPLAAPAAPHPPTPPPARPGRPLIFRPPLILRPLVMAGQPPLDPATHDHIAVTIPLYGTTRSPLAQPNIPALNGYSGGGIWSAPHPMEDPATHDRLDIPERGGLGYSAPGMGGMGGGGMGGMSGGFQQGDTLEMVATPSH